MYGGFSEKPSVFVKSCYGNELQFWTTGVPHYGEVLHQKAEGGCTIMVKGGADFPSPLRSGGPVRHR